MPIVTTQVQLGTTISTSRNNKRNYFHARKLKNVRSFVSILVVMVTFIIYTKFLRYYIPNDDDVKPVYNSTNLLYKDLSNPPKHRPTEQQCAIAILRQVEKDQYQLFPNENCTNSIQLQSPTPSRKKLTYLLLYYNDYEFLAQQLQSWNQIPDSTLSQIKFIIIDDGSAIGQRAVEFININQNYEKSSSLDLTIYEIDQDLAWNIGGARNLGFWLSSTEW